MMTKITLTIPVIERDALRSLAEQEYRDPRMQAALLLHEALERRGLLQAQADQDAPENEGRQCLN